MTVLEFLATLSWAAVFQIILIDLLLGGDNAVVIALACRDLPPGQRMQGILWGTAGAILLRIVLIFFALTLLGIPFLKIAGGLLLLWIGIKLLIPTAPTYDRIHGSMSIASVVKTVMVADLVMSLDNVIAIAGAAQSAHEDQQFGLVLFGLIVSVPIIVWGSTLVLKLIDRYPLVVTLGAGLLGWIAGGMVITDTFMVHRYGEPGTGVKLTAEIIGALLVIVCGRWRASRRTAIKDTHESA